MKSAPAELIFSGVFAGSLRQPVVEVATYGPIHVQRTQRPGTKRAARAVRSQKLAEPSVTGVALVGRR